MQRHSQDVPGTVTAFLFYEGAVGTELFTLMPKKKRRDFSPNLQLRRLPREQQTKAALKMELDS